MFLSLKESWPADKRTLASLLVLAAAAAVLWLVPSSASAWAPAATAPIHPGVMTSTEGSGQAHGFEGLNLVDGTEPFQGKLLGRVPLP